MFLYIVKALKQNLALHSWKLLLHCGQCTAASCVRTWTCVCVSEPHLKTGNSEATGIVRRRGHRDDEGAVWDVLVVETNGHLIVSYKVMISSQKGQMVPNTKAVTDLCGKN